MEIAFATGNKGKLAEATQVLSPEFKVKSIQIELPELQGEPDEITRQKTRYAAEKAGGPVICEDTSLCFVALKGLPGPYIKWFLDKLGHEGLNRLLSGYADKSAYALCVFGYSEGPGAEPIIVEGRCYGRIVPARNGSHGFGWDPVFQPDGYNQTYAEMPPETKNQISHRAKALEQLRIHLKTLHQAKKEKK